MDGLNLISFRLDIKLLPSPRPRVTRFGTYMPKKYTEQKKLIKAKIRGFKSLGNLPLRCEVVLGFKTPLRVKKNKYSMPLGDVDNYVKTLFDSMEGICFENDRQIVDLHVTKEWCDSDYVEVKLDVVKDML